MAYFTTGFYAVSHALAVMIGGASAILLFIVAMLLFIGIAGAVFDRVTQAMALRWNHKGHHPHNRFAQIILDYHRKQHS